MSETTKNNLTSGEGQIQQRRKDWIQANQRLMLAITTGCDIFKDSALVNDTAWKQSDVDSTRDFLVKIAPLSNHRIHAGPGFAQHLLLASIYHRRLAEKIAFPGISPKEAGVIGLLHDVGRIIDPDYFTNDIITEIMLRGIGTHPQFLDKFYPLARILGRTPRVEKLEDLTIPQRIDDVGDNMAKLKDGEMFTVEQMVAYCESTAGGRYQYVDFDRPSKRWGLKAMEIGRAQLAAQITVDGIRWMENEFGIDFAQLGQEVYSEFQMNQNQQWIEDFEKARPLR